MHILMPVVLGAIGSFFLYIGATLFLDHSSLLARYWHIPLMVIGLLLVSFGTSLPELIVGLIAGSEDKSGLVLGNILGSNVANIGLVLGISVLIYPIQLSSMKWSRLEIYSLLLSVGVLYLLIVDGTLSRIDGIALVALGIGYIFTTYTYHQHDVISAETASTMKKIRLRKDVAISIIALLAGLTLLLVGAQMVVHNAVALARLFHLSEVFIGITLVAIGTSLPEIITSVVGSLRKSNDLVLGNVVGSNIINILIVLGITVCITPVTVSSNFWEFDLPILFFTTLILARCMYTGKRLGKLDGVLFICIYVSYVIMTFFFDQLALA